MSFVITADECAILIQNLLGTDLSKPEIPGLQNKVSSPRNTDLFAESNIFFGVQTNIYA